MCLWTCTTGQHASLENDFRSLGPHRRTWLLEFRPKSIAGSSFSFPISAGKEESAELGSTEYEAHAAVISGLVETLETLRKRNNGRFPTKDRITQAVILNSVVANAKGSMLNSIARLLHIRPNTVHKAAARQQQEYEAASAEADSDDEDLFEYLRTRSFYTENEKSCNAYPLEWTEFVGECWDNFTRASECAKDEARDPVAHESGAHHTHRIHWINTRLIDLRDMMRALGKEKFGPSFSLSEKKMLGLKRYYHRYPGRNTCLCRYHMSFDNHYYALRKWKNAARRELPEAARSALVVMPDSPRGLRLHLQCPKEAGSQYYHKWCTERKCTDCHNKLSELITPAEMDAVPMISYQRWTEVPYITKDNRVIKNHDFLPDKAKIADFITMFDEELTKFLPHHNQAKFLDNDWAAFWGNVSRADDHLKPGVEHWWDLPEEEWLNLKVENRFGTVIDYANSYSTEHKDEHMQQFWSSSSTTLLGCVMKIAVQNLNDTFFAKQAKLNKSGRTAAEERMEALRVLAENHMPPEVIIIMHAGVTSNPHHDTAGIQHFFQYNLYPWLKGNTNLKGAHHVVRSDGCAGQMKSGRHFRFVANFHTFTWNLEITLVWSHSESCHGKDLSDPECGRMKFILRCHEMRHTAEDPTMLKTSLEQYQHLLDHHCTTRRTLREKKGKGILLRVYHWMPAKSIRPLKSLAEVKTLEGCVTLKSHFFTNCRQVGCINVRKIACLNCMGCTQYKYVHTSTLLISRNTSTLLLSRY